MHPVTYLLPFVIHTTLALWRTKALIVTVLCACAFFTLTWSPRQWNYCTIVLAATPFTDDDAVLDNYGGRAARLANLASRISIRGSGPTIPRWRSSRGSLTQRYSFPQRHSCFGSSACGISPRIHSKCWMRPAQHQMLGSLEVHS